MCECLCGNGCVGAGPKPSRDGSSVMHEGRPWTESAFVPMHEVRVCEIE
jgi:hypothetical protein